MSTGSRAHHIVASLALLALPLTAPPALPAEGGPRAPAAAAAATHVPMDRASYFGGGNLQAIWKDLESRQAINQRIVEGGSYSVNVRIVRPDDAPLVHGSSADVWIVQAGTATAVTGGELLEPAKRANTDDIAGKSIRGGAEQALKQGDVVFVPPGVPHAFSNLKGFRALLIRFDVPAPAGARP